MSRPDSARIARNAQSVFVGAGEAATLRVYVSGITGAARFGVNNTFAYQEIPVTALFASVSPTEVAQGGGQTQQTRPSVSLDRQFGTQDEIIWRGSVYRIDGTPTPETIGGRVMWRSPLVLVQATG